MLITLRFLGYGGYQRVVGQGLYLAASQPSVSRSVRQVTRAIYNEFLDETIRFPSSVEEREEVDRRYSYCVSFIFGMDIYQEIYI